MSVSGRVQLSPAVVVPAAAVRRVLRRRATYDDDVVDDDDRLNEPTGADRRTASRSTSTQSAATNDRRSAGKAFQPSLRVHCEARRRLAGRRHLSHPGVISHLLTHLRRLSTKIHYQ